MVQPDAVRTVDGLRTDDSHASGEVSQPRRIPCTFTEFAHDLAVLGLIPGPGGGEVLHGQEDVEGGAVVAEAGVGEREVGRCRARATGSAAFGGIWRPVCRAAVQFSVTISTSTVCMRTAERLLAAHTDDGTGRCRACPTAAGEARHRSPCAIRGAATEAVRLRGQRSESS